MPDDLNDYEKSVALYLDNHPEVLWWYRNLVGPENFSIQGYLRSPIYPDFVVQRGQGREANRPGAGAREQGEASQGEQGHELQAVGGGLLREDGPQGPVARARRGVCRSSGFGSKSWMKATTPTGIGERI